MSVYLTVFIAIIQSNSNLNLFQVSICNYGIRFVGPVEGLCRIFSDIKKLLKMQFFNEGVEISCI